MPKSKKEKKQTKKPLKKETQKGAKKVAQRRISILAMPVFWLWIAVATYAVLQILTLGTRSFDGDEGVILNVVNQHTWNGFWTRVAADVHPPLYHILAKASVSIFGVHEWSLRIPAAAAGGALILLGYWLGCKVWANRWKALVLGILLGFAPYLFYYHQEARFYTLLLLGAVITYGALLDLIKKPNPLAGGVRSWIIFLTGALILVFAQHLGWLILGAEFLTIIILRRWKIVYGGLVVFGLLIIAYLPFIKIAIGQFSGRFSEQGGWLVGQNITGTIGAIYRFGADRLILGVSPQEILSGGSVKMVLFAISLLAPLTILIFGFRGKCYSKEWSTLSLVLIGISILVALFVSEIGGRSARYLIYLWPFYGAWLIDGMVRVKARWWGKVLIGLLLLLWLGAFYNHLSRENTAVGARAIAQYLDSEANASDVVLVKGALAGGEKAALEFYLPKRFDVADYYADYRPGELAHARTSANETVLKLLDKYRAVWYYDFTYGKLDIEPSGIFVGARPLGDDKEQQEIVIYKITR